MGSYSLEFKPSAHKELYALLNEVLPRVFARIGWLAREPRPRGCKKLKGHKDLWRIRIGDWRVLYIVDDDESLVSIVRVAHRREVYE